MMERSSRFISLSGLSGVAAGVIALFGAAGAFWFLNLKPFDRSTEWYNFVLQLDKWDVLQFFLIDLILVLLLALMAGIFFTKRRARKAGILTWGPMSKRLLQELAIPLIAGGLFCLALLSHGYLKLIPGATLIFYGLALVNGSKYTLSDVKYLGITEIALGLVALFWARFGLEFWTIGFGILHIVYGLIMYFRHERNEE